MLKSFKDNIILPLYRFLISLKLAVTVIVLLMAVLIAGTIIESRYGATSAKMLVYDAPFMSVLLVLLAANLLAVALSRLPWQKKHIGFVMTHFGVITILVGSLVTRYTMTDGQMILTEGETSSTIILSEPLIQMHVASQHKSFFYEVPGKPFAWEGRERIKPYEEAPAAELYLLNFYPKARGEQSIVPAESGPGALKVRLKAPMMEDVFWLFEGDRQRGDINLGPVRLMFARELAQGRSQGVGQHAMYVEFNLDGKTVHYDFPAEYVLPLEIPIEGTGYLARVTEIFKFGIVSEGKLVDKAEGEGPDDWRNPAIRLTIEGEDSTEDHTVFSNFPDFPTVHGKDPGKSGIQIHFHPPHAEESAAGGRTLRFVSGAEGKLQYQIQDDTQVATHEARLNEDIDTGWMGMGFRVEEFYPHAQIRQEFSPRSNISKADEDISAVQVLVKAGDEEQAVWLAGGDVGEVSLGGNFYQLRYGRKRKPLGFSIQLKDFNKDDYPGTRKAMSFSSDVVLIDSMRGLNEEVTISMNEPLVHRGFFIYQSAYRQSPGEPEISIFSVGKDPGIPFQYTGSMVMVLGILTMILMQRSRKRKEVKKEMRKLLFWAVAALILLTAPSSSRADAQAPKLSPEALELLDGLPVQHGGRIKPLISYAREIALYMTGKTRYEGYDATILILDWMAYPKRWLQTSFLPMAYKPLEEKFGLRVIDGKLSPENVLMDQKFVRAVQELSALRSKNEKLPTLETKELELYDRASVYRAISDGRMPGMLAVPEGVEGSWLPLSYLAYPEGQMILAKYYDKEKIQQAGGAAAEFFTAWSEPEQPPVTVEQTRAFVTAVREMHASGGIALDYELLNKEVRYHRLRPFKKAWMLYGIVFLVSLVVSLFRKYIDKVGVLSKLASVSILALFVGAILVHSYGFYLRVMISGRPPVTNMYESMIWVAWVAAVFAGILFVVARSYFVLNTSCIVAMIVLILAERFPAVFNPSIDTLVPVLRSNFWLTVHVLTITMSYGAFALAWGIGHAVVFQAAFFHQRFRENQDRVRSLHRILMIGVVLLAAGTILGGVWANYSWGRFWGWDPKETWALIALLGYLAVLHGRFAGWLGNFGLAAGAVGAFLGVVMAWYGVNYVLGAGLHSYGFGGGGATHVLSACALDLGFVFLCLFFYRKQKAKSVKKA